MKLSAAIQRSTCLFHIHPFQRLLGVFLSVSRAYTLLSVVMFCGPAFTKLNTRHKGGNKYEMGGFQANADSYCDVHAVGQQTTVRRLFTSRCHATQQ
jgi:hypothetical protein